MKKAYIVFALIIGISLSSLAAPAKRGLRSFNQPDGSKISLHLKGDERFHTYLTEDGYAVKKALDGIFYYMTTNGISSVKAHNINDRNADEIQFLAKNESILGFNAIASAKALKAPAKFNVAQKRTRQVPQIGSPRIPVILVAYSDYSFKDGNNANNTFLNFFQTGSKSARQYFVDQSNGKFTPVFDVYGPVTLSKKRSYYGGNDDYGDDMHPGEMVAEACLALDSSIDFSKYDNNGDGECDVVIVLYAGDGESSSYDKDAENAVWPHQWDLFSSDYNKNLTLDKTKIGKYAAFNELYGGDLSKIDGIGTFCHEFSHCIDLPDFYDTEYGNHFGMAHWSIMDYGCYNDDGFTPVGYSAYEKYFMEWITLNEGAENTFYTLPAMNQKSIDSDIAIKVTNPNDSNEYYILENRRKQGWDKYLPTEGLMISHVTYDESVWFYNTVNNTDKQRMTIIPADNNLKLNKKTYYGEVYYEVDESSLLGDLWPYAGNNELTDESTPAAKVFTGNYMSKPITKIAKNDDGTVSFWFMKTPLPSIETPIINEADNITENSFNASWSNNPASDVTYTLEVTTHRDIKYELVLDEDFTGKTTTWTPGTGFNEQETVGNIRYMRLGSSKKTGFITSPSFSSQEDGLVTVVINAEYYLSDSGTDVKVSSVDATGNTIDSKTIRLTDEPADYKILLTATPSASTRIKIESLAVKKRVCLYQAKVYTGDATELEESTTLVAETGDSSSRIITGINSLNFTVTGLTESGVFDFRVKAVPYNTELYNESAWSEKKTVYLVGSGVSDSEIDENELPAEFFNLQGIKVRNTDVKSGIFIMRKGNKVSKIIVN